MSPRPIVFDWAGAQVDGGSRAPMGLPKRARNGAASALADASAVATLGGVANLSAGLDAQ